MLFFNECLVEFKDVYLIVVEIVEEYKKIYNDFVVNLEYCLSIIEVKKYLVYY